MKHLRCGCLLILLMLAFWPANSVAGCILVGGKETVTMAISSPIMIDPSAPVGTVLATSPVATPSPNSSWVWCNSNTNIGVINLVGAQPSGSVTIYPTGVAGVGYRILHPDSSYYLPPWNADSIGSGSYTLDVGSALQLVKTGPISGGSTLNAGTLGYWQYDSWGSNTDTEDFALASAVTFVAPTCTVTTPNISVALPTVSDTSLSSTGETAGGTAFAIGLNCAGNAAGRTLAIQFDTASSYAGLNGVIKPSGSAKRVGVQLVDGNFAPVTFGTATVVGTTPSGQYNLTYYARYYATGSNVKAGTLSATATFTLSYP